MELKRISEDKSTMEIEFKGEDHTFLNLLREAINNNSHHSAYRMNHPLLSAPSFFIRTKDGSLPKTAIVKALNDIDQVFEELEKAFQSIFEKTSL
ncbi:MAG: RpoL/Rpb11 RNA polymerase subunit family protein [Candidatus Hodarchaeota archaeon]